MAYNPNVPALDNLVQNDIAAMRENFQHLDPLAQVVDELQTVSGLASIAGELQVVSGLAPITDDLQVVSELAPYVQAILDSRIVDHNLDVANPPNGWYVRYESGKQECWGIVTTPYVDPQLLYTFNLTWPAAFARIPAPAIVPQVSSTAGFGLRMVSGTMDILSTTGARYHIRFASADAGHSSVGLTYYAVGVWK